MNALEQLEEALRHLGQNSDNNTDFDSAAWEARYLQQVLNKTNSALGSGWGTVGNFCDKIAEKVRDDFEELRNDLSVYIQQSKSNEDTEQKAVNEANQEAEMILKELGIN